jgi:ABC-type uncharacterized transport system YnjBCD ATPase subunit
MNEHLQEPGESVAHSLGDYEVYAQQLLMIAEREFSGLTEPSLHFESFSLGRKVFLAANADIKRELQRQIAEAEAAGESERVAELMAKFQSIIKAEA